VRRLLGEDDKVLGRVQVHCIVSVAVEFDAARSVLIS